MHHKRSQQSSYIGRFAPSPTGNLHLGSLATALASYLDAKSHGGQWLVRMENIDPPREVAGAADNILRSLEAHELFWDQEVLYQSQRLDAYQEKLDELSTMCYECNCTRKRLITLNGCYDGHCLRSKPKNSKQTAIRLRIDQLNLPHQTQAENFEDIFQGKQFSPLSDIGDIIIRRKDSLFAYQLAVAVDDLYQNITHVIRGYDLIESTCRQRYIMLLLLAQSSSNKLHLPDTLPIYGHSPLVISDDGAKLSKQTHAEALDDKQSSSNLLKALAFLNHTPPIQELNSLSCKTLLEWAIKNWKRIKLPSHTVLAP